MECVRYWIHEFLLHAIGITSGKIIQSQLVYKIRVIVVVTSKNVCHLFSIVYMQFECIPQAHVLEVWT